MAKIKSQFVCQTCGYQSAKSMGRCPECQTWNSFVEERAVEPVKNLLKNLKYMDSSTYVDMSEEPQSLDKIESQAHRRKKTGMEEFDRVLGGGIVEGSLILVGGEPGIGKSTLMLQMAGYAQEKILYVSGEESVQQIKSRAERMAKRHKNILIYAETNLNKIVQAILKSGARLIIVDSIQTLYREEIESAPGSVSQVRECAAVLMHLAKSKNISVFLVGHVTKDGVIAGPKVLEHMVDTVLQFEGDAHHFFRILRATKNRFGSTNEIGIFEMKQDGLAEVSNPSELFLSERYLNQSGSAVVPILEGTRVLLVEVQGLATLTNYGMPQRTTSGFDLRRLQLLIAVLEKRGRVPLGQSDVFLNIAGGLKADEPAMDLGVALAIVSSLRDKAIDPFTVVVGEVGLGGEIRAVSFLEHRIREAQKLGFEKILVPKGNLKDPPKVPGIEIIGIRKLDEAFDTLFK